jgi:hypothetical protein
VATLARALICWFRGHSWRYDGHMWASGMTPHDCYVCATCGRYAAEPLESDDAAEGDAPIPERALAPA